MQEITEQKRLSGDEEKSKEGIDSGLIAGKCRAGVPCQQGRRRAATPTGKKHREDGQEKQKQRE